MENNQDQVEEVKSCKLWVKLKIPRDEVKSADFENQVICFEEKDDQMKDFSKNMKRVCHVCHKPFSSGKALGGHMRIHFQKAKKNPKAHKTIKFKKFIVQNNTFNGGLCDIMIKEPICIICSKDFRSMKSLYGHMRCHPDRDWRGINPPWKKTKQDDTENEPVHDLKESLWGWKMTAKRGRKALMDESKSEFSSSDDDHEAVNYLMMLARGKVEEKTSNGDGLVLGKSVKKFDNYDQLKRVVIKTGKEREKLNLCELKSGRKVSSRVKENDKYRCNACGKLYSSHQALGGHSSSCHNKLKFVIQDSNPTALVEEEVDKGSSNLVEITHEDCTSERMLDFDLNELPP